MSNPAQIRTNESPFLGSVTDLMTSLAVIFIMLLVLYIAHYQHRLAALKQVLKTVVNITPREIEILRRLPELEFGILRGQTIKKELKEALSKLRYKPEDDPRDVLAIVYHAQSENLQFDVDRSDLKDKGKQFLREFIPSLVEVLERPKFYGHVAAVVVEGHTDSDGDDEHNLQLSQQRSFAVLQFGLNDCSLKPREREHFLQLTSITGRGERGLLPPGAKAGSEQKDRSRRVEFIIRIKSFEQDDDLLRVKSLLSTPKTPTTQPETPDSSTRAR